MNPREYRVMFLSEEEHWWYRGVHDVVVGAVSGERAQGQGLRILDAGCGTGRLCQLLAGFGHVSGCDDSPLALELAMHRGVHAFAADLESADLGTSCYDVITSIDVLYHQRISRQDHVLRAFHRALRDGGLLLLHLPAFEFLRSAHDVAVHTRQRYTRQELEELVRQAGFSVVRSTYLLCMFLPLIALVRFFRRPKAVLSETHSDVHQPRGWINSLLTQGILLENRIARRWSLPWGSSVFLIARKEGSGVLGEPGPNVGTAGPGGTNMDRIGIHER